MSTLADELQQLAEDAARARGRLEELARACAELRAQLARQAPSTENAGATSGEESPQRLQSVS
jgi:BMFP domain-containing protein YqiC